MSRRLALGALAAAATLAGADDAAPAWSGSLALSWYVLPGETDYALPVAIARRDRLHLEARFNYEDRDTASLLAGWTFAGGGDVELSATPMLGAAVGRTDGVAGACTVTAAWKRLALYSENEVLVVPADSSDSFYYNWTELTCEATGWLRAGIVTQRTRVVRTDRELERGLLVGVTVDRWSLTGSWFEPGSHDAYAVLTAGVEF